ncbi:hypothetical protein DOI81_22730 [Salmonella enterica subsp. enterica serovar Gaminara]|nr:hypothetical protein [Salmonella enterica subsp. enterica serovar Gaminara]
MGYIILKGLFEPDSVAHFAGSLIYIVLNSMIIYVVLYDLAHNFKTHCKSVIKKLRTSSIDSLQVVMLLSLLFAVFIFVTSILTYPFIGVIMLIINWIILGSYLSYLDLKELNKNKKGK